MVWSWIGWMDLGLVLRICDMATAEPRHVRSAEITAEIYGTAYSTAASALPPLLSSSPSTLTCPLTQVDSSQLLFEHSTTRPPDHPMLRSASQHMSTYPPPPLNNSPQQRPPGSGLPRHGYGSDLPSDPPSTPQLFTPTVSQNVRLLQSRHRPVTCRFGLFFEEDNRAS